MVAARAALPAVAFVTRGRRGRTRNKFILHYRYASKRAVVNALFFSPVIALTREHRYNQPFVLRQ